MFSTGQPVFDWLDIILKKSNLLVKNLFGHLFGLFQTFLSLQIFSVLLCLLDKRLPMDSSAKPVFSTASPRPEAKWN
jgi:hypothetical protein